jgi:hypothetical protein
VIARLAQLSYLLWPSKRRSSNANFGHVLGLPPGDRRVRMTALDAYAEYARYLVETMRLPSLPHAEAAKLIPGVDLDAVEQAWRARRWVIFALGHIGKQRGCRRDRGARLADQRPGRRFVVPRDVRRVQADPRAMGHPDRPVAQHPGGLRRPAPSRDARIARRLGLPPRRHPGPHVRGVDHVARGSRGARRQDRRPHRADRHPPDAWRSDLHATMAEPIDVRSSARDLPPRRRLADAVGPCRAPAQWYSFKPIWPSDPAEGPLLEARAAEMALQLQPERETDATRTTRLAAAAAAASPAAEASPA